MNKVFLLLLKREIKRNFFQKKQLSNYLITLFTFVILFGVFLFLFYKLLNLAESLKITEIVLIYLFAIALIVGVISNLNPMTDYLLEQSILDHLPISMKTVILVKASVLYLRELTSSFLIIGPILGAGLILDFDFGSVVKTILVLVNFPLLSMSLNMILSNLNLVLRKLKANYRVINIMGFIATLCGLIGLFYFYSKFLEVMTSLLLENKIPSLFSTDNLKGLTALSKWLYPVRWYSGFLKESSYLALGCILLANIVLGYLSIEICQKTVAKSAFGRSMLELRYLDKQKKMSVNHALYYKEIKLLARSTLRSSCLKIILVLPIVSLLLFQIVNSVVTKMFGSMTLHLVLPFQLMFLVILIGLTNLVGFVSREGLYFNTLKTLPVDLRTHLRVKLVVSSVIMQWSILATLLVLLFTSQINCLTFLVLLIIEGLISAAMLFDSMSLEIDNIDWNLSVETMNANFIFKSIFIGIILGVTTLLGGLIVVTYYGGSYFIVLGVIIGLAFLYFMRELLRINKRQTERLKRLVGPSGGN